MLVGSDVLEQAVGAAVFDTLELDVLGAFEIGRPVRDDPVGGAEYRDPVQLAWGRRLLVELCDERTPGAQLLPDARRRRGETRGDQAVVLAASIATVSPPL